ncbi:hypothetical protein JCM3775_003095 [Rhodotorula graminis]|uniref:Polysaccharide lyase family 14 protein n=1 Tax=Rhodotorula graminis (strain WP1) TaxID=578459 RepID=A0A194S742_RHOGW|nr:uncharacterized protein RHOBADRAFT_52536 [Rhodotorula graminis WP1]KPV76543.1 hypothetical protein RHOBADRAFT_52536 [Rhodotorula graminis WP1]
MYSPPVAVVLLALAASSLESVSALTAAYLADGNYYQSGSISNTFRWQASGPLAANRCPRAIVGLRWPGSCYTSSLGATGNLQTTTQQQYLAAVAASSSSAAAARKYVALAASPSQDPTDSRSEAELRALQDDEDLDAYFEAFPEQEPYRFPNYASFQVGSPSFKAKRQVNGCGPPPPSTTVAPPSSTTTSAPSTTTTAAVTPRQRNELFTWPGAVAGQTWRYTWKSWQATTSTNFNFHHAWQILRRDGCGGAVITLDYLNGQVVITDTVRDCKPCATFSQGIDAWFNKEITHEMTITYGLSGSIMYTAYVKGSAKPAIAYRAQGDMGSSASLKIGNYRRSTSGQQASTAYIGAFTQTRLA